MAKEFSKAFYRSDVWKKCRQAYISERVLIDGGMCEDCKSSPGEELHHVQMLTVENISDYKITLDPKNLMWLCKDCHFKRHRELIMKSFSESRQSRILNDAGYYFDDKGELQKTKTVIVWGSPASGKTTYVLTHMEHGDLVVDLDSIKSAISGAERGLTANNLLPVAIEVRDHIYSLIEKGCVDSKTKWIIATLPKKDEREALAHRLKAELIYIDATYHECLRHIEKDGTRKDKLAHKYLVDKWWERFEA